MGRTPHADGSRLLDTLRQDTCHEERALPTIDVNDATPSYEHTGHGPAAPWGDHRRRPQGPRPRCGDITYAEQPDDFAYAVSVFAAAVNRRTTQQGACDEQRHRQRSTGQPVQCPIR